MGNGFISGYIARNYSGTGFTQDELNAIKEGELETLLDTFVKMKNDLYMQQLKCVMKGIKMFLGEDILLEQVTITDNCRCNFLACQIMDGDEDVMLGIAGQEEGLLKIASVYGQEDYSELDADAYDAICELINCINGFFATKLSNDDVEVILRPPVFYENVCVNSKKEFYVINMSIQGMSFDIVMALSGAVCFESIK